MNTPTERTGDLPRCVDCGADLTHETRCYVFDAGRLVKGAFRCLRCDRGEPPDTPPADRATGR